MPSTLLFPTAKRDTLEMVQWYHNIGLLRRKEKLLKSIIFIHSAYKLLFFYRFLNAKPNYYVGVIHVLLRGADAKFGSI